MARRRKSTSVSDLAPRVWANAAPAAPPVLPTEEGAARFLYNEEFHALTLDDVCEFPASTSLYADRDSEELADLLPGGIDSIGAMPVLSPAGERFLFRKMNYLKYRAWRQREVDGTQAKPRPDTEPSAAELLADAEAVRRHLAECNLRLVASIARRFAAGQADFDELLSEGNVILLKAIDRFDYARGFRFSTYLTYSVQRHLFRLAALRNRRRSVEVVSRAEVLEGAPAPDSEEDESLSSARRIEELVRRMDECLTQREQWVVRERFGLGKSNAGRPFREIAEEAGLSKERVRQIQLVALSKLKEFLQVIEGERGDAVLA